MKQRVQGLHRFGFMDSDLGSSELPLRKATFHADRLIAARHGGTVALQEYGHCYGQTACLAMESVADIQKCNAVFSSFIPKLIKIEQAGRPLLSLREGRPRMISILLYQLRGFII